MLINNLKAAAEKTAARDGYFFYYGDEFRMAADLKKLPCIWITIPDLVRTEGRNEGIKQYEIVLYIMEKKGKNLGANADPAIEPMEKLFDKFCEQLSFHPSVQQISEKKFKFSDSSHTPFGEMSLDCKFKLSVYF